MFNNNIDFDNVKDTGTILPEGTYIAIAESIGKFMWTSEGKTACDSKDTPETSDEHLEVKFQIVEGEHKGRTYFANLQLWHDNDIVANIARSRFKQLCLALCIDPDEGSFDQLIDRPVKITLKHSKTTKEDGTPYVNVQKIGKVDVAITASQTNNKNNDEDVPF